jgi:hypothetical protein
MNFEKHPRHVRARKINAAYTLIILDQLNLHQ